jgi:hypothetical protein
VISRVARRRLRRIDCENAGQSGEAGFDVAGQHRPAGFRRRGPR